MFKKVLKFFIIFGACSIILNIPLTTSQGINFRVKTIKIPLYIKLIEFVDRDYNYKILARDIIGNRAGDEGRALAIFDWVKTNIHDMPTGFDVIDDHVLNIIIRRYGTYDQMADVFTTLCVYAGVPAFWRVEKVNAERIALSYVKLGGRWRVFDIYRGIIFRNNKKEIASVEDILSDIVIVSREGVVLKNATYEDFFKDLQPIKKDFISKEERQKPFRRIIYEIQ